MSAKESKTFLVTAEELGNTQAAFFILGALVGAMVVLVVPLVVQLF